MDINDEINNKFILSEIDKKIIIKFIKEKKTSRTYIFGLEDFVNDINDRKKFMTDIKKLLGTAGIFKKENNMHECIGFNGNHIQSIREFIMYRFKIPSDKIVY